MATKSSRWLNWVVTAFMLVLFALSLSPFVYANYQSEMRSWDLVLSSLLLSVPLALLFFSIGLLIIAGVQKRRLGRINQRLVKFIYYTPRIAGVVIILFVGMFSLDAFSEGRNIQEMLFAFFMHNIPVIIMALILWLAWRRPVIGFVAFLLAALFFLRTVVFNPIQGMGMFLLFSGPMLVIAVMFWLNWRWKKEMESALPG